MGEILSLMQRQNGKTNWYVVHTPLENVQVLLFKSWAILDQ